LQSIDFCFFFTKTMSFWYKKINSNDPMT
jgi:hypothetical protein